MRDVPATTAEEEWRTRHSSVKTRGPVGDRNDRIGRARAAVVGRDRAARESVAVATRVPPPRRVIPVWFSRRRPVPFVSYDPDARATSHGVGCFAPSFTPRENRTRRYRRIPSFLESRERGHTGSDYESIRVHAECDKQYYILFTCEYDGF